MIAQAPSQFSSAAPQRVPGWLIKVLVLLAVLQTHAVVLAVLMLLGLFQAPPRIEPPAPIMVEMIQPPAPEPVVAPPAPPPPKPVEVKPQPRPEPKPKPKPKPAPPKPKPTPVVEEAPRPAPVVEEAPAPQPAPAPTPVASAPAEAAPAPAPVAVTEPNYKAGYLRNPAPAYPNLSRRRGEEGVVMLKVRVSSEGEPLSVEVARSSGFERLDEAALKAVRRWRFVPARRGDQAVEAWVRVPVNFRLES